MRMRGRAVAWMFAALSTVEPLILDSRNTRLLERNESWCVQRLPMVESGFAFGCGSWMRGWAMRSGSTACSTRGLDDGGGAAEGQGTELLGEFPSVAAYVARGKERAVYWRAFGAQPAVFCGRGGEVMGSDLQMTVKGLAAALRVELSIDSSLREQSLGLKAVVPTRSSA